MYAYTFGYEINILLSPHRVHITLYLRRVKKHPLSDYMSLLQV